MIKNLTRQTTIAASVEIARTPFKRLQGLCGRTALGFGEALVITHCQSIHMMFMKFPIDVIFIDGKGKTVGLAERIKPFAISPIFWKSSCAIELPAGTIEKTNTQVGDQLKILNPKL